MIRSLSIFALLFCILGNPSRLNAQAGDPITFSVIKLEPCRYRLFVSNTSPDCFNQATLLLQTGYYTGFMANSADGWVAEQLSPTELLLTHSNGLFPVGSTRAVDFSFFEPGGTDPVFSVLYPNLCLMESYFVDFPLEGCPGGSISGTVYRECTSKPYTNQAVLNKWTIQLADLDGNLIASTESGVDGSYSFFDLPPAMYRVKSVVPGAWTPNVPASGQWQLQVNAAANYERDFGNCPDCSCDSIDMQISQEAGNSDTSTYYLLLSAMSESCFQQFTISIDTGEIVDYAATLPGWIIERVGNTLILTAPAFLQVPCHYEPCKFRLRGAVNHVISVSTSYAVGMGPVLCTKPFTFPKPACGAAEELLPNGN
ncbi:MAG: hypothetical protein IPH12_11930 [Saprospirales bacterium]|nr:hypothetical protein [Saprospirales bacterium]